MPCYSVNTVSLDFQAGDQTLLQKAAAKLGLEFRGQVVLDGAGNLIATLTQGKAICSQTNIPIVNKLRVQYSREIVGQAGS